MGYYDDGFTVKESLEMAIKQHKHFRKKIPYREEFTSPIDAQDYLEAQHFQQRAKTYFEKLEGRNTLKAWICEVSNIISKKQRRSYTFVSYAK